MSTIKKNFGSKPYARKSYTEVSNLIQRSYADSFAGSPAALRTAALATNPLPVCYFCGLESINGEQTNPNDHIYSVARGGISVPGNFAHICQECNSAKGALHPLIYWRKRKTNGQALWLTSEEDFLSWLQITTAPYRELYPEHYEVSSRLEQTVADRQFLKKKWSKWYREQIVDLESDDFWFSEGRIARAEELREYLPKLWPNHFNTALSNQRSDLCHLGLLVELFGDDSKAILDGSYDCEDFYETINGQIDQLYRDKGKKNRQAQKYTRLMNAILRNCYGLNVGARTARSGKLHFVNPVDQALENCRNASPHLTADSSRLNRRLTLTRTMAEYKKANGSTPADRHFSKIYASTNSTEKSDMRFAARAAGVKLEPLGVTPLAFGNDS